MIKAFEDKWFDIELILAVRKEAYYQSVQNPCKISRGRAGWELLKKTQSFKARQKELIHLADQAVSEQELSNFLESQQIQFKTS